MIRAALGMTQGQLGDAIGISRRAYQDYEGGVTPFRRTHELALKWVALQCLQRIPKNDTNARTVLSGFITSQS